MSRKPGTKMEHTRGLPVEREGKRGTRKAVSQAIDFWQMIPKLGIDIHQYIDLRFCAYQNA
jgi:hypothetical protein